MLLFFLCSPLSLLTSTWEVVWTWKVDRTCPFLEIIWRYIAILRRGYLAWLLRIVLLRKFLVILLISFLCKTLWLNVLSRRGSLLRLYRWGNNWFLLLVKRLLRNHLVNQIQDIRNTLSFYFIGLHRILAITRIQLLGLLD